MAMSSSSSENNEVLMPESRRPAMPADLLKAALKGDSNVLIPRLGLPPEAPTEIQVTIETSDPVLQQILSVQSEIGSATRSGDTLLHLLIANRHNELALKVFAKDRFLLKAHNNKSETPLYCAAMVANYEVICDLIGLAPDIVRDVLGETNENGDTALHVAASNNHGGVVHKLMELDLQAAHKENNQGFSPLYIATVEGNTSVVKKMLEVDGTLACTQFFDGTFPIHVAARMGNTNLVKHFLQEYPGDAMLLDPCGRNLFHVAAEQDNIKLFTDLIKKKKLFTDVFTDGSSQISQMVDSMVNAKDYEGNTPLHIAAMKGHKSVMRAIWNKLNHDRKALLPNHKDKTPFDLSVIQVMKNSNKVMREGFNTYVKRRGYFTPRWFDYFMEAPPISDKLGIIQVIGLGAVLIATVSFAAAFTIPGGYNANDGTPILARRHMYRLFVLANTSAFVLSFLSVLLLISNAQGAEAVFLSAEACFLSAAICMVLAFGTGSYVMLAPVNMDLAKLVFSYVSIIGSIGFISYLLFLGIIRISRFGRLGCGVVCAQLIFCAWFTSLIFLDARNG